YHAIPLKHFLGNPSRYIDISTIEAYNLDEFAQSVRLLATIHDTLAIDKTPFLLNDSSFVINSLQKVTLPSRLVDFSKFNFEADSAYLKSQFTFYTGDNYAVKSIIDSDTVFYKHVDFRSNDTASIINVLHNYYAYDDGTAEFSAGISQQYGNLAYQFSSGEEDTLRAIQINFSNISPNPAGRTLELTVWNEIGEREVVYAKRNIEVQTAGPNNFIQYDITPAVVVRDTFYIGWTQSSEGYLGVGLDKDTDSGDKIWYNINGTWAQNTTVVGSLMMRPVFGRGEVTTAINEEGTELPLEKRVVVFPNPSEDKFYIKGAFKNIKIYDIRGMEIKIQVYGRENGLGILDLSNLSKGIYIAHIYIEDKIQREKLILK
ncbi:MAG: T9SS type A sorting domain-containing protein, partial [Bacteroidota bacterium]|nr:T9SS type A sorting domain-containing protein [Bacteroidota bacterium]